MKQEFTIIADTETQPEEQVLSLRIGERHAGFCITTAQGRELFQLNWYTDEAIDDTALLGLHARHPELDRPYSRVNICYDYPQSVMVPLELYKEHDSSILLTTLYGVTRSEELITERVGDWQINNVYAVPKEVRNWASKYFPTGNYWHSYTITIKNIEATNFHGSMLADFRTDEFSLLVSKANKLLLAQTFQYATPADVIYYLLDVCNKFALSQDDVKLAISGLVDKQSGLYKELYQYFVNIDFRDSSWTIMSGAVQDYPRHFFTSLNDLAKCAS